MHSPRGLYSARGVFDGKGLTVFKGSSVNKIVSESWKGTLAEMRAKHLDENCRLIDDIHFKSPSAASNFVSGRSANGWVEWVTPDGVKLSEYRNASAQASEHTETAVDDNADNEKTSTSEKEPDTKMSESGRLFELADHDVDRVDTGDTTVPANSYPEQPDSVSTELHKTDTNQQSLGNPALVQSIVAALTPIVLTNITEKKNEEITRLEEKLDFLIETITEKTLSPTFALSNDKTNSDNSDNSDESERYFRLEPTKSNDPVLVFRKTIIITGLIFTLKLHFMGTDGASQEYRVFFANSYGRVLSKAQTILVTVGEEYICRFELNSAASEEEALYLVIQSTDSLNNEAKQLIECPVKIAFAADFGI